MDFFRKAGDLWHSADRATGGWLPGGGTASPLTRSVQNLNRFISKVPQAEVTPFAQKFNRIPGAEPDSPVWDYKTRSLTPEARSVLQQLGQNPDVTWDINKTNPVAKIGDFLGYPAATTGHANPLKNQIFLPLSTGSDLKTLIHEAGHLDTKQRLKGRPIYEGILGQAIDTPAAAVKAVTGGELSPFKGTLAPFRMAGGLLTGLSDAKEEDYAEKFTMDATKGMLGKVASSSGSTNRSVPSYYAESLYGRGVESFREGLRDVIPDPVKFFMGQ